MGKLYELLAAESDLRKSATKLLAEAKNTFLKKTNLFVGYVKRTEMFNEDDPVPANEEVNITDSVISKLNFVNQHIIKHYDGYLEIQEANQRAKADIVIDGQVLASDVPGTFLLGMEQKLVDLRSLYESIPTLRPGILWEKDEYHALENVFRAKNEDTAFTTKKSIQHKVIYEATKEHPAQVERWTEDIKIGKKYTEHYSAMLPASVKAKMLTNIDKLIIAVKAARTRANAVEVSNQVIGETIFDFIHDI